MVAARPSETRRYMYGIRPALSTTIFCVKKKNCGCGAAELCLTSRWSDRQGAKPEDGGTSLKHGFGDAEQEQLGCSLVRHLRSCISGGRIPQVTFAIAHFTGGQAECGSSAATTFACNSVLRRQLCSYVLMTYTFVRVTRRRDRK